MKTKEYKLFKSVQKTATTNNLVIAENNISTSKVLFDFSILDMITISDIEKEIIKNDALKNVCAFSKKSFYGAEIDNFTTCIGIAKYYAHPVYSISGKRLYIIMQLAKVNHTHTERKSVYDAWESTKTEYTDSYTEPVNDLEIA